MLIAVLNSIVRITFQLCGCAGHSGLSAQAHVLLPSATFKDPKLHQYCFGTENCHRVTLLHSVGSLEDVHEQEQSLL